MPSSASDTAVSALKLFVWGAKLGTLGGWVEIATSAADLIGNVKALDKAIGEMGLTPLAAALDDIRRDAARALRSGHGNSPHKIDDAQAIFDQTALAAFPSSSRLIDLGLDPDRVLAEMLATAKLDRDFRETAMAEAYFTLVLGPVLKRLLNDVGYLAKLGPDFQRKMLASDAEAQRKLDALLAAVARPEGLSQDALLILARRINADVADPDTARRELERAVEIAANVIAEGLRGSNIDAIVDEVLKRIGRYTAQGRLPDARAVAAQALDEAREGAEKAKARHLRLLDAMIEQDTLARDVTAVCDRVVEKLALDHPDPATRFESLRKIQDEWYERGRDKGLAFDLEVSIGLSRRGHALAADPDQRGSALNDLGTALRTLGERESGTARLDEAVAAYRAALEEWTRDRVPLDWAMTQMNLGTALGTVGEREPGTARLDEAVAAFRAALEERTRDRVPLGWATAQMNLGTALWTLGEREKGTGRLNEAVAAYRAALQERTRDRMPFDWARSQRNLGNALLSLGERESGTSRLMEAVAAYRAALEESTRDRVPLEWAMTQMHLGIALTAIGEREPGTALLDEAVAAFRAALTEWTRDRLPLDWARTQNNLGIALQALGEREGGTARLEEAAAAYRAALEEWTRDRVPLDWARTQNNLGNAEAALFDKTSDPAHLDRAKALIRAAREVFAGAGASHYLDMADRNLAKVVNRLTP